MDQAPDNSTVDDAPDFKSEAGWMMPSASRYAGLPIDTTSRRSIRIVEGKSADGVIAPDAAEVTIDEFYHQGRFWRAIVPVDSVTEVCGQGFNFSRPRFRRGSAGREIRFNRWGLPKRTLPMLNHVQTRFRLDAARPIRLYRSSQSTDEPPAETVDDVVYSVEVAGPTGVTFNLRDAFRGHFVNAHRFLSTREMVFERIVIENQYVAESPPLPLDAEHRNRLLVASLLRSDRAGMSEHYYLYRCCGTNNCTSNAFEMLDEVVTYDGTARLGSLLYRLPLSPRFYLRVRGLDSNPAALKLVRKEFESYIQDAETQQRKRSCVKKMVQSRRAARSRGVA